MRNLAVASAFLLSLLGSTTLFAAEKIKPSKVSSVSSGGETFYCYNKGKRKLSLIKKGKRYTLGKDAIAALERAIGSSQKPSDKKKLKALKTKVKRGNQACNGSADLPGSASLAKLNRALTKEDIQYLLDKAALGQSSREAKLVQVGLDEGIDALVDQLISTHDEPAGLMDKVLNLRDGDLTRNTNHSPGGQRAALLHLWINTNNPYQEKFALALLSIWTVAGDVIDDETFRHNWWGYYQKIRDYAYADRVLPDLAVNLTKDPLMLVYLNNEFNVKGNPNENYARELLELFTVGPRDLDGNANYTETQFDGSGDIAVAARMLTGWKVNKVYGNTNSLVADDDEFESRHEYGPHTMFAGKPYQFVGENYDDLVRGIFTYHPSAQNYYAAELLKLYVTLHPPRSLIEAFGQVIKANDFNLNRAMKVLLRSEAFFDPTYRDTVPMNAFEFAAKTARLLEMFNAVDPGEGQRLTGFMGMEINMAPSVFWYNPKVWVSSSVSVEKGGYLSHIMNDTTSHNAGGWSVAKLFPQVKLSKAEFIDFATQRVGVSGLSSSRMAQIESYLSYERNSDGSFKDYAFNNLNASHQRFKGMGVMYLMFLTAEFNLL